MLLVYRHIALLFALCLVVFGYAHAAESSEEPGLTYRLMGPVNGGRASRVVGVPGVNSDC